MKGPARFLSARGPRRVLANVVTALIVVLAALALTSAPSFASHRPTSRATTCPQVLVLGAAGSGERTGSLAHRDGGVGADVYHMWLRIRQDVSAQHLAAQLWADPYPADSVSVLVPSQSELNLMVAGVAAAAQTGASALTPAVKLWADHHLDQYMDSIKEGAKLLDKKIQAEAGSCPSTAMIAVGYSQGAMVVHSGELTLAAAPHGVLTHVAASILLGDGFDVANTQAHRFGTSPKGGEGIATWYYLTMTHQTSLVHDVALPSTTAEVCDNGDIVCDFSAGTFGRIAASERVHTSYGSPSNASLLNSVSDWAAAQTASSLLSAKWSKVSVAGSSLHSVSCTASTFCVAVGDDGLASLYDGVSWSPPQEIDGNIQLDSVSCTASTFCVAVDSEGDALTYNGTSWTSQPSIDPGTTFNSVSCVSTTFCMAVDGQGNAFSYNGAGWMKSDASGSLLGTVSCTSSTFCVSVGYASSGGDAFLFNGTSWSSGVPVDPGYKLHSISCVLTTFCVVGASVNVFSYNGTSWSGADSIDTNDANGTGLSSVSCPSATFCATVDAIGNVLTFNGSSWSAPQSIDGDTQLNSISCPSSTFCVAVDANGNVFTMG